MIIVTNVYFILQNTKSRTHKTGEKDYKKTQRQCLFALPTYVHLLHVHVRMRFLKYSCTIQVNIMQVSTAQQNIKKEKGNIKKRQNKFLYKCSTCS